MEAHSKKGGRGGARPGAGRPKGSSARIRATQQAVSIALKGDPSVTPLAIMLSTMKALWSQATAEDGKLDLKYAERAAELAKDAAPFVHPRLANIDMKQSGVVNVKKVIYQATQDGRMGGEVLAGEARQLTQQPEQEEAAAPAPEQGLDDPT